MVKNIIAIELKYLILSTSGTDESFGTIKLFITHKNTVDIPQWFILTVEM